MTNQRASQESITSPQAGFDALRYVSAETPCPYLPGRLSRSEAYWVDHLDPTLYEHLLARGFRRSGRVIFRPRCRGCQECRQLRIPVHQFMPTRSMRRILRRNADVRVEMGTPVATDEKYDVFHRYLDAQHDETMSRTYDSFLEFLYDSPIESHEFRYHLGKRLIGVGIVDHVVDGLSSVYMYFDPDYAKRSLGTFSVIQEVRHCQRVGLAYYYLGFYVGGSRTMAYKARFRPNEVLVAADRWVSLRV